MLNSFLILQEIQAYALVLIKSLENLQIELVILFQVNKIINLS